MQKFINDRKDLWLSLLRTLFTLGGSVLIGKAIMGTTLTEEMISGMTGSSFVAISFLWGYFDKEQHIEGLESVARQLITSFGGFLVGTHKLSGTTLNAILAMLPAVFALTLSYLSRQKNGQIDNGQIDPASLSKLK